MANKKLAATITIGGAVASTLRSAFGTVKGEIGKVGSAVKQLEDRQKHLNQVMRDQERLGRSGSALKVQYAQQELALIDKKIAKLKGVQTQLARIDSAQQANLSKRAELRGQIVDVFALGAVAASPIIAAAKFETAMLGVAKQVNGARDAGGKLTTVYRDMAKEIQKLGREIPIATNEIADMVAAGARMGIQGKQNLLIFTRNAAMMADAFELPAGELADQMGKIAGLYKIPIPAIGELADSINYLDDNAISKGADIIDFLTRVGGAAGSVKIASKDTAALGSTLLTLGERAETASTATNAMFSKLAAAEKGTKKFRAAMDEIGLSLSGVQKGMQKDATATILKVLDAVGRLKKDKQTGVLVELFGLEHADTIAKLANNTAEYRKQLAMANSEASKGSMGREFEARLQTTSAQMQLLRNRTTEVAVNFGTVLLPAVNSVVGVIGSVAEKMATFAQENPRVSQAIAGTVVALTSLKVAVLVGGYAYTFLKGAMLTTMALFYRTAAAATVAGTSTTAAAAGPTLLGRAFMFAGKGVLWLGRALLLNPIGIAVTAIATAAYLIYDNWGQLKPFFTKLWADIVAEFNKAISYITGMIDSVVNTWTSAKNAVTSGVGDAWRGTKNFLGFGDEGQPASNAPAQSSSLPAPAMATARGQGGSYTDNSQNTYQITQQPGENSRDLARRITEEQERQRAIKRRSSMTDGAMAQ